MENEEIIEQLMRVKRGLQNNNLFTGISNNDDLRIRALDKAIKIIRSKKDNE